MGVTQNLAGFFVVRFFLGATEAGLFPGVVFYFSMFYKRIERQYRVALFFSMASLAGAFGGILAWGIAHMDGVGGYAGWRWIFILVSNEVHLHWRSVLTRRNRKDSSQSSCLLQHTCSSPIIHRTRTSCPRMKKHSFTTGSRLTRTQFVTRSSTGIMFQVLSSIRSAGCIALPFTP